MTFADLAPPAAAPSAPQGLPPDAPYLDIADEVRAIAEEG